jgi:hypothetical protein
MTIQEEVTIEVGQSVDVSLESMMGSTGYGWELASLKGNVNLVGISVQPTSTRPIAPVIQVFSFRGVGEGSGKAVFVLTAPWKVEKPKKEVVYTFNVVKAEDADTDDALRLEGFTASPTATVRAAASGGTVMLYNVNPPRALYNVNPPITTLYNVNMPSIDPCFYYGVCPPGDDCCNQPQQKYNILPPACVGDDCCNPPVILKYNVPMPPVVQRYNIPMMRYNFPSNDNNCC